MDIASLVLNVAAIIPKSYVLDVDDARLLQGGDMPSRINEQLRARGLPELETSPTHAAQVASFIFHSLAAKYAEVLSRVAELTERTFRKLYIMRGGSQNLLLNKLTARATGLQVIAAGTDGSTIGNFAVQMTALRSIAGASTAHAAGRLQSHSHLGRDTEQLQILMELLYAQT